ncbi:hypothetical protein L1887_14909 [Cichorium endivia]|nr:hypothetical protein L1887_14909 [Cichorium endivia]
MSIILQEHVLIDFREYGDGIYLSMQPSIQVRIYDALEGEGLTLSIPVSLRGIVGLTEKPTRLTQFTTLSSRRATEQEDKPSLQSASLSPFCPRPSFMDECWRP